MAFVADLDAGGRGLFSVTDGVTTLIADTSGPFSILGGPMLNDLGQVAFGAVLNTGEMGLYTGTDLIADRVIGTGDLLDGSTVTSLNYHQGLNNHGQIAFYAELADGRSGLYVATAVPEPSSLLLLGGGLLGLWTLSRRRRRPAP